MTKTKSLLLLFIFLLSTLVPNAYAEDKSIESYWRDVGLDYSVAEKMFRTGRCYKNEPHFVGCIMAINAILTDEDDPYEIVSKARYVLLDTTAKIIHRFDNIIVIEKRSVEAKTPYLTYMKARAQMEADLVSWGLLFHDGPRKRVNFEEILAWAKKNYITAENESFSTAIAYNAFLSSVKDPHTMILPRAFVKEVWFKTEDNFFGIGAIIRYMYGTFIIHRPLEGSPALKAGLKSKDIVTHINNEDITDLSPRQTTSKIRGPEGTTVTLTIKRKDEILNLTIVRGKIVIENIESRTLDDIDQPLAYVKLRSFIYDKEEKKEPRPCLVLRNKLVEMKETKGLILDLRNNTGGMLSEAVCISSLFIPQDNVILTTRDLTGKKILSTEKALRGSKRYNKPLIILINADSASASEIVAGVIQDYQKGVIVGDTSFGKGSVQYITAWRGRDDIIIKKTLKRFHLPTGRTNQIHGITPDLFVYHKPYPTDEDKFALREKDRYTTALRAIGPPWKQPRPGYIKGLGDCAENSGHAETLFEERQDDAISPDYQLLYAQDVMACMLDK